MLEDNRSKREILDEILELIIEVNNDLLEIQCLLKEEENENGYY